MTNAKGGGNLNYLVGTVPPPFSSVFSKYLLESVLKKIILASSNMLIPIIQYYALVRYLFHFSRSSSREFEKILWYDGIIEYEASILFSDLGLFSTKQKLCVHTFWKRFCTRTTRDGYVPKILKSEIPWTWTAGSIVKNDFWIAFFSREIAIMI